MQYSMFENGTGTLNEKRGAKPVQCRDVMPFKMQLLKWIGNKQKFAHEIISYFPENFGTYYEPFLGAGGIMATLMPEKGVGSDGFLALVDIWKALSKEPETLKKWYAERWHRYSAGDEKEVYEQIKHSYNAGPNGADLVFLSRSCYGGVIRYRQSDGYMSTPMGVHNPITPMSFAKRVDIWHERTKSVDFHHLDYTEAMSMAKKGDLIYCDPPYSHSQTILYGAQNFELRHLLEVIEDCKKRGVYVVLSIDGTKKSGDVYCDLPIPPDLFEHEIMVNLGPSMLRRFQMGGQTLEAEIVKDRLLLTY